MDRIALFIRGAILASALFDPPMFTRVQNRAGLDSYEISLFVQPSTLPPSLFPLPCWGPLVGLGLNQR
jgi:hypothetical protein